MAQQQQTQQDDAVRVASDPTKMSAFDLIERNIMRDVEADRRSQFQTLETANGQNTFGGLIGRVGLETFEKYRHPTKRVASYVNQAIQMAVDHHNFLVRREELGEPDLVFSQLDSANDADLGTSFSPKTPAEVIRLLTIALMALDAGATDSLMLKQQALAIVERNVTTSVEKSRREAFQTLASTNDQNTLGGLVGRIGLETVARYRLSEARIKSYINQAYQAAVDHYNFVSRRESLERPLLSFTPLVSDSASFDAAIPAEVVRLIVLSYIANDNAAAPTAGPLTALAENQRQ